MKNAFRFLLSALCFSVLTTPQISSALQIFENAEQSDGFMMFREKKVFDTEASAIAKLFIYRKDNPKLATHCTSFFVENDLGKPLMISARHCAGYEFSQACNEGRLKISTTVGSHVGTCVRTVAESQDLDMVMFEVAFAKSWNAVRNDISGLELSSDLPQLDTPLKMLGYPASETRKGQFTVTNQCWVNDGKSLELTDLTLEEQARYKAWAGPNPKQDPLATLIQNRFIARHNCSIYGGNSGGPILIEGTKIVLGLPTTYWPGSTVPKAATTSQWMDSTVHFIQKHQDIMKAERVKIVAPYR